MWISSVTLRDWVKAIVLQPGFRGFHNEARSQA